MPIYEYACKKCGHQFEMLVLPSDDPKPECPKCKHPDTEKLMSAASVRAHGIPTGSGGFKESSCRPAGRG